MRRKGKESSDDEFDCELGKPNMRPGKKNGFYTSKTMKNLNTWLGYSNTLSGNAVDIQGVYGMSTPNHRNAKQLKLLMEKIAERQRPDDDILQSMEEESIASQKKSKNKRKLKSNQEELKEEVASEEDDFKQACGVGTSTLDQVFASATEAEKKQIV